MRHTLGPQNHTCMRAIVITSGISAESTGEGNFEAITTGAEEVSEAVVRSPLIPEVEAARNSKKQQDF